MYEGWSKSPKPHPYFRFVAHVSHLQGSHMLRNYNRYLNKFFSFHKK